MGSENFWSTFILGTLEAGKHDVNNVNNVQCLMTVSIGEILSPGEEVRVAASISDTPTQMPEMPDTQQRKDPSEIYPTNSASEDDSSSEYQPDDEPTLLNPKAVDEENQPPSESALQTRKYSAPQLPFWGLIFFVGCF